MKRQNLRKKRYFIQGLKNMFLQNKLMSLIPKMHLRAKTLKLRFKLQVLRMSKPQIIRIPKMQQELLLHKTPINLQKQKILTSKI